MKAYDAGIRGVKSNTANRYIRNYTDFLLRAVLLACFTFDVFDDTLAERLFTLSHLSLYEI